MSRDQNYKWWVLGIVMIGTLMAALDTSIVNVSIPAIMADFAAGIDDIEWVITAYMLAFATLMPLTAWLRDRVGHKTLYLGSLLVFTLGSVLCGMAWDLPSLIVARVIQALGGGALSPTGMAMVAEVFEPRERGKAMGIWGTGVILGPAFGPTLGGYLTNHFGWRSIFLVNLPIGILGLLLSSNVLIPDKPPAGSGRRFDFSGFAFLSLFLISFLLGISKGEKEGWASTYVVTCMILSVIGLAGFFLVESLVPEGIVDLKMFRNPVFSVCALVTFVRSIALFGGVFLLPLFLQQLQGLDEIQSGLILLPGSLVMGMLLPFTGRLGDRFGPRILALSGLVAVAYFMYMYRNLDVSWSQWDVIKPTLVRGLGLGCLMAPIMAAAMNSVPRHKTGMASSMLNLIQQVGGSIGISVLATVLSHRMKYHLNAFGSTVDATSSTYQSVFRGLYHHAHSLGLDRADSALIAKMLLGKEVAQTAFAFAFQDAFLVGALMVAVALVPAWLLPNRAVGHGESTVPME